MSAHGKSIVTTRRMRLNRHILRDGSGNVPVGPTDIVFPDPLYVVGWDDGRFARCGVVWGHDGG